MLCQFLLGSLLLLHSPSRTYLDPFTGDLFGEGGVEKDLHTFPASAAEGVHGGVIMSKLGNATAKYVPIDNPYIERTYSCIASDRAELGRATWKLLYVTSATR